MSAMGGKRTLRINAFCFAPVRARQPLCRVLAPCLKAAARCVRLRRLAPASESVLRGHAYLEHRHRPRAVRRKPRQTFFKLYCRFTQRANGRFRVHHGSNRSRERFWSRNTGSCSHLLERTRLSRLYGQPVCRGPLNSRFASSAYLLASI